MIYRKNLPSWERISRSLAGIGLIVLAAMASWGTAVGWVLAASGTIALLTGFWGFCPICAMAGRRAPADKGA